MQAFEFNKLSLEKKLKVLSTKGNHIGERSIYGKSRIELYRVYEFYTEVFYDVRTDELQQITTTTESEIIHNYIDLREVYLSNKQIKPPPKE